MSTDGTKKLTDCRGGSLLVVCEDCELLKKLEADDLLAKHGNIDLPSLLRLIAGDLNCQRLENSFYERCRLHYHRLATEVSAAKRSEVDAETRFSDLREWHRLYAGCRGCGRRVQIDRWKVQRRFGKEALLSEAATRLVCKKCGAKGFSYIDIGSMPRD